MAEVLSSLTKYVDETKLPLIRKSVLGAMSTKYFVLQTGVVGETALNLLATEATLGNGLECGWAEAGTSTVSQRKINPAHLKVNMSFCDRKMQEYFLNHEIRVAAGQETLPSEEAFINGVIDSVNDQVEQIIWNGTSADGGKKDGLLDIAKTSSVTASAGGSIYESVKNVYMKIPANSLKDSAIYMGVDKFRELVMELTAKNLYHYDAKVDEEFEIVLPGTSTPVRGVAGLNGKNAIVAVNDKHTFYGTDMQNDEEVFDFWYSKDNQEFRLAIKFNAGVQVAFLDEVVYCALA